MSTSHHLHVAHVAPTSSSQGYNIPDTCMLFTFERLSFDNYAHNSKLLSPVQVSCPPKWPPKHSHSPPARLFPTPKISRSPTYILEYTSRAVEKPAQPYAMLSKQDTAPLTARRCTTTSVRSAQPSQPTCRTIQNSREKTFTTQASWLVMQATRP